MDTEEPTTPPPIAYEYLVGKPSDWLSGTAGPLEKVICSKYRKQSDTNELEEEICRYFK
jgi:hypothetical protein